MDESEIVFLATPFQANQAALGGIRFNGKTLIDCTNPVGPGISHGLKSERSGSEVVQENISTRNMKTPVYLLLPKTKSLLRKCGK